MELGGGIAGQAVGSEPEKEPTPLLVCVMACRWSVPCLDGLLQFCASRGNQVTILGKSAISSTAISWMMMKGMMPR